MGMVKALPIIAQYISYFTTIAAGIVVIIKPLRDRLFGLSQIKEGQKCLLRRDMLNTYYRHMKEKTIRQYEYENFVYEYCAYKALGGNSFVDKIHDEVKSWMILS